MSLQDLKTIHLCKVPFNLGGLDEPILISQPSAFAGICDREAKGSGKPLSQMLWVKRPLELMLDNRDQRPENEILWVGIEILWDIRRWNEVLEAGKCSDCGFSSK